MQTGWWVEWQWVLGSVLIPLAIYIYKTVADGADASRKRMAALEMEMERLRTSIAQTFVSKVELREFAEPLNSRMDSAMATMSEQLAAFDRNINRRFDDLISLMRSDVRGRHS